VAHLLRDERRALVEACLAELPEAQRELLLLRGWAGHGWDEIARATGRASADAARVAWAAALAALGQRLRGRFPGVSGTRAD
jgi:DNA-directed RNA polymerase specialized sigma24 family protein